MSLFDWFSGGGDEGTNAGICVPRGVTLYGQFQMLLNIDSMTAIFQDPPLWDSDQFFNPANLERVTIPDGLDGRYFVHASIQWVTPPNANFTAVQSSGGYFYAELQKTGASLRPRAGASTAAPVATARRTSQIVVWETELAASDFIELHLNQYVAGVDPNVVFGAFGLEIHLTARFLGNQS